MGGMCAYGHEECYAVLGKVEWALMPPWFGDIFAQPPRQERVEARPN